MIPGIHINTFAEMLLHLGLSGLPGIVLLYIFYGIAAALDSIYSVALNIPDGATGIAPAASQRMAAQGMLGRAVYMYLAGGVIGAVASLLLIPIIMFAFPTIQPAVQENMFIALALATTYFLLKDFKWECLAVFIASGIFGVWAFGAGENLIFPMFVGFFTLPMLMVRTASAPVEPQHRVKVGLRVPLISAIATACAYLIPGMATPTIIIVLAGAFASIREDEFVAALGAINASNIAYSILMTDIIGKARTGVAIVALEMHHALFGEHLLAALAGVIAFSAAAFLLSRAIPSAVSFFSTFNNPVLKLIIAIYLCVLIWLLTGPPGILVAGVACVLGTATLLIGAHRTSLMGSIIVGALLYYA
ncbi:MAG: tripartite tricarboxylate transporter permease [Candidatus Micrarchaeia archaeon]